LTIDGFSGEYTTRDAATLLEELAKRKEFSEADPSLKFTMRSNGFKSGTVRTYKVCLSNPRSLDPPHEYVLNKHRVTGRPKTSRGESEERDNNDSKDGPEEGEAGPSRQLTKKVRR